MSSETDHPRQRTVAELLAQHGGEVSATGRRRRRREAEDEQAAPAASTRSEAGTGTSTIDRAPVFPARPAGTDRSVLRDPAPQPEPADRGGAWPPAPPWSAWPAKNGQHNGQAPAGRQNGYGRIGQNGHAPDGSPANGGPANGLPTNGFARNGRARAVGPPVGTPETATAGSAESTVATPQVTPAAPGRDRPTDVMPRYRDEVSAGVDGGLTAPIPQQKDADDAGPATMIGAAPAGAESWHRARTEDARRAGAPIDGGPPLPPGPVEQGEEPAGLGDDTAYVDLRKDHDAPGFARGLSDDDYDSPRRGRAPVDDTDLFRADDEDQAPASRERRLGRSAAVRDGAAPVWAAVVGQWVAGALGGAVLWVLFRFLWRSLPVVALAAAVLATVGLVVLVRALLRNDDMRTTVFAVLVGLLLTVSPAILVLLGR